MTKKHPLLTSLFRTLSSLTIIALLSLLFWSTQVQEEQMIHIRQELKQMKKECNKRRQQPQQLSISTQHLSKLTPRPHIDPNLPNLLTEDPFFTHTLPNTLLPKNFIPKHTMHLESIGQPNGLHPFSSWSHIVSWWKLCLPSASKQHIGIYEKEAPSLAIKIEERTTSEGILEFWVHLREGVLWEPLTSQQFNDQLDLSPHFLKHHPVTAHDFKFFFDAMMNPHVDQKSAVSLRTYYHDLKEIDVIDDLTFVVRWDTQMTSTGERKIKYVAKQLTGNLTPLPRFVYQYYADGSKVIEKEKPDIYRTHSVWGQFFNNHWAKNVIVSCGPWIFHRLTDEEILFVRNPNYFDPHAALYEKIRIKFKESPDGMWQSFKAGTIDYFPIQSNQLLEWEDFKDSDEYKKQKDQGMAIHQINYPMQGYRYIGWNSTNPLFQSKMVRRAMTQAINRERIIKTILSDMALQITGPFNPFSPETDSSIEPWPYDPETARRILENEGWFDEDGDGIIEKEIDGKRIPFEFRLTYYVKDPTLTAICSYIASALKEIGVHCILHAIDITDLSHVLDEKNFEAIFMGWVRSPPP